MLRRKQDCAGAELRTIESRQAVLGASLDDWQEVMDLAVRFSTRCAAPAGAEATAREIRQSSCWPSSRSWVRSGRLTRAASTARWRG
jgi:hypothetical protein